MFCRLSSVGGVQLDDPQTAVLSQCPVDLHQRECVLDHAIGVQRQHLLALWSAGAVAALLVR